MTKEIRLPAPHPRFRPRLEGDLRRPGHPGTTVQIGEDLYEVMAEESSGREWIYRLEPWTGRDTIRVYVEWGEGAEREFAAHLREARIREQKNLLAWGAQAFVGFLPARVQERRCQAAGLDPARATFWSALLEALVALPFVLLFFIGVFAGGTGASPGPVPTWIGFLASVALADGVFRLVTVLSIGEPIGSIFFALLDLRSRSEGPRYVPGDEILKVDGALTVVSTVRKVWWEKAGGVTYGGESFILAGSGREKTKCIYRFQKGGEGFPVLDPGLEKARNRSSDLSYVFALLWGFLPPELQRTLESYGRYRARPYVIISIGFTALAAVALAGPGLRGMSRGDFGIGSLVSLAAAATLLTESVLRLLRLVRGGKISGSLLAFLVKPVYNLVIKGRAAARS
jgi:hypothetical protein